VDYFFYFYNMSMTLTRKPFISNLFLFLVVLTVCRTGRAQSAQVQSTFPHTLLWRISGNGLQKPSYLYGTMHLNDKRLFRFDDSVYRAIEKTEGLAIEVNPDEMAAYFVNQLFDQLENGKKLQEILDQRYFNRNRNALAKKFNKPAEEISASDVVKEKNKWMSDYMQNGEMPTFMDAYLYNIARRQGKWVGGIEDLSDQTGLMADLIDQSDISYLLATDSSTRRSNSNRSIEEMIRIYSNQDLEGIESISSENSTAEVKDMMLIRRNLKMARRIDSLISLRTMFLAIGAAHLPGDSGVISLLRRRGFTLEPVFSNKKIQADDYTFTEVHLPWVQVTDDQGYYTAEMPANPAKVKLYGLIEMRFLMDLFNMSGFCTAGFINSSHIGNRDSLFNMMSRRMFHDGDVKAVKNLELNGVAGKEYIQTLKGENLRVQIFANDKMIYLVMLSALKKEMLSSADAGKFFQSFTINPQKEQAPDVVNIFTDSIMGVSFATPVQLTVNDKLSGKSGKKDDSWKNSCFTGIDRSGNFIMLISTEVKPGYHIPDENKIHDQFYEGIRKQYSNLHKDSTTLDSTKLIKITGKNIEQPGIFMNTISIVKDGRHILLMVLGDSSSLPSVFSSFRFISHPSVIWQKYESPDSTFSSYAPAPIRPHFNKWGNKMQWVSYDTTRATSYEVIPDTLGKYTWYLSDSLFWRKRIGEDTANENCLELKDVVNGNIPGKEFIIENKKDSGSYSRTRLLLTGNKVYKLFAAGRGNLLSSTEVNRFFNDFRIEGAAATASVCISKASLLLHDLGSMDSATRREAYSALFSAKFGKEDIQLLKDALFRPYQSPYDSSHGTTINNTIAQKFAELGDSTAVTYVRESYPLLVNAKRPLKNTALSLLAHQHTAGSYATLVELLKQGPTGEKLEYTILYAMKDSLALTRTLFPSLQSWIRDTLYTPGVAFIALPLLDSGYLTKESIMPSAHAFIEAAAALLPALKTSDDYSDYKLFSLLKLIGRFHIPASYSLLKNYLAVRNKSLLLEVVKQLLDGGQAVPGAVLNRLASDPVTRLDLYDNLKKYKKTALFPGEYLTQSRFAESSIYGAADNEDEGPIEKVVLLSKKTASFDGKKYTWYLYKISYTTEDGPKSYLGIAGGYDPAAVGLRPKKDMTGVYWEEELDAENSSSLFKEYLKGIDSDK
jgi:uncharacterized protein YbaP (TraB family)